MPKQRGWLAVQFKIESGEFHYRIELEPKSLLRSRPRSRQPSRRAVDCRYYVEFAAQLVATSSKATSEIEALGILPPALCRSRVSSSVGGNINLSLNGIHFG